MMANDEVAPRLGSTVIDIESLTIKQARELAAILSTMGIGQSAPAAPTTTPGIDLDLAPDRIGKVVLVRSRGSGVWIGTLVARSAGAAGHSVSLADARRIWSWTGAAECSQLALTGPKGGKIGVSSSPIVHEVLEEFAASNECVCAVASIPEWRA